MKKNCVLIAGIKSYLLKSALNFIKPVFADEPKEGDKQPPINYEQLIAQARKEEKDKLYPQIEKLKKENSDMVTKLNDALLSCANLQKKVEELSKQSGNSAEIEEELKKAKAQVEVLETENTKLKEQVEKAPKEDEIVKRLKDEYEVKDYLRQSLAEHGKDILKVFQSDVKGNTKEEVDASIQDAIKRSEEVREEVGVKKEKDKKTEPTKVKRPKNVTPPDYSNFEEIDPEYVRSLDPSSEEYKEFRKKVLGYK